MQKSNKNSNSSDSDEKRTNYWYQNRFHKSSPYYSPCKDALNHLLLSVEKRQFFNQNNQWLNNNIYH